MAFTLHYGLQRLNQGEAFALNGQKYTTLDRDQIDRLLFVGAQDHHHLGHTTVQADPTVAFTGTLNTSVGGLPANTRIWYQYTWVDPDGFETAASPEFFTTTPTGITTPLAPALSASGAGGTMVGGGYFYGLSVYTGSTGSETLPASNYVVVPGGTTGSVTLTYPALPSGATGWNIYRRSPGESGFFFLASVVAGATPPTTYVDTGAVAETCSRLAASSNTTSTNNSVMLTLPVAIPTGFTWNVYRTFVQGNYANALLYRGISGATTYVDVGNGTLTGNPPAISQLIPTPTKIDLATETTGVLPLAQMSSLSYPVVLTFSFPGAVVVQSGKSVWTCEFATAQIVNARASLGRGKVPASTAVIVDVLKGTGQNPTYSSVYGGATPATKPQVAVGKQVGVSAVPNVTALVAGDTLSVDVTQAGGGATPTDADVTVNVLLVVSAVGLPVLP